MALDQVGLDQNSQTSDQPQDRGPTGIDPVIAEAKQRLDRTNEWESQYRNNYLSDIKFAEADSYNGYQWPNAIRRNRDVDERPCLTVNMVRQHNLQIINNAKQNKPEIKFRPTGNGATKEAAQAWQDIARHIEHRSNAQAAYDLATGFQVKAGMGCWRVITEYAADETFEQEIRILPMNDPLAVYIDPDCVEPDKSDMNFAFIFANIPKSEFNAQYPDLRDVGGQSALGENSSDWLTREHVRVCEYFRRIQRRDEIVSFKGQDQKRVNIRKSKMPQEMYDTLAAASDVARREIWDTVVEWFLIIGERVVEKQTWPGKYIPIVILIGEETIIEGLMDRKGHTRAMMDPQRIYNYWTSSAVEHVALQGKTPYKAPAKAIEGYETYWNNANKINASVLPYNDFDDDGERPIAAPEREPPPQMAPAYVQGMQVAAAELERVSGQFASQMGEPSNERTGQAITARQRQGDNATYHFIDNLAIAVRHTGKILLDLAPKIYDTERALRIMAENGEDYELQIDPGAKAAFQQRMMWNNQIAARIFNPAVGTYEVEADTGPAYASKREEAWNAFSLILTQAPQLTGLIGDVLFRAGDFPGAEEAAERIRRMVPPQALGQGPTQQEQQLQMQVQNLQGLLTEALGKVQITSGELKAKDQLRDIDAYDSETKRMAALAKMLPTDPQGLRNIIEQLVQESLKTSLGPVLAASAPDLAARAGGTPGGGASSPPGVAPQAQSAPPVPGAKRASDGHWYLPDHRRPGKYLRVLYNEFGQGPQSA